MEINRVQICQVDKFLTPEGVLISEAQVDRYLVWKQTKHLLLVNSSLDTTVFGVVVKTYMLKKFSRRIESAKDVNLKQNSYLSFCLI